MLSILALAKARAPRRDPSDLDPASNAGQGQKPRNPWGARQKGRLAASLARYSPVKGMRLTRSLPSAPSASTRGPLQYFNSLPGAKLKADHRRRQSAHLRHGRQRFYTRRRQGHWGLRQFVIRPALSSPLGSVTSRSGSLRYCLWLADRLDPSLPSRTSPSRFHQRRRW